MQQIRQLFITLRSSLWFIPGLMIFASIALAFSLIEVDGNVKREWLIEYPRIFGLGADGSRGMLTAIAGSMLTVAALAFSLTLSIIAQASGQFTPRILRNFMRDRVNQFVLGYFVSVFAFCLIILRTIRGEGDFSFVPSLGVVVGLVLAIGGIVVLIFFIHHIAASLEVTSIITDIEEETAEVIDRIFPEQMGEAADPEEIERAREIEKTVNWYPVNSLLNGYIQYVDTDGLLDFAIENDLYVRMEYGVGQFVVAGTKLVSITKSLKESSTSELNSYFNIYRYRTIEQDAGFGIRQIVDIALKALSPGINDTTTAISCIDYLAVIISKIADRKLPTGTRIKNDEILVFVKSPSFEDFVTTAFDQIRINGKANLAIFLRILKALSLIAEKTTSKERKDVIKEQILLTEKFANETLQTDYEKDIFNKIVSEELENIKYERV